MPSLPPMGLPRVRRLRSACWMLAGLLGALAFAGAARGGESCRGKSPANLPVLAESAAQYAVAGWRVEREVSGDLNGDGRADAVLELIEDLQGSEGERLLLVLLRSENGSFRRIGLAERLLRCAACFGMMSGEAGGNAEIAIRKGILVVTQLWGSREIGSSTQRFRFEPSSRRMRLIGEDLTFDDRARGDSIRESSNHLTGVRVLSGKVYDEKQDKLVALPPCRQAIGEARAYLEDADCEQPQRRIEALPAGSR
jgi:hypothetical protein